MDDDGAGSRRPPAPVRLHPHRGIGWGVYGTGTAFVALIGIAATAGYLRSHRWWMAGLCVLVAVPLTAFLALLTDALVRPLLIATPVGIGGRMPRGGPVGASWEEVTIDVDDDAGPATLRLRVGEESVSISARAWLGFADFVELVARTPRATARLTPAGLREVRRYLRIGRADHGDMT